MTVKVKKAEEIILGLKRTGHTSINDLLETLNKNKELK
jgi:hypothetical protein